ncbi:MAG TPA: site-specific integrase [Sporichthyaceae bacterium]|jgi:integrase|nr:site-specific integrase [Sporichthyaceae bacterium]
MASVEKRIRNGKAQWYARYRDPAGQQRTKSFERRVDAERFLTGIESSKITGSYIDPVRARLSVGEWSERWLDGLAHVKPSTRERYAGILREHVSPRWRNVRLGDVGHADVQRWVTDLGASRSPATVRKVHRVLSLVLALAVKDGRLVRNVAAGISLPRVVTAERRYLNHEQTHALATASGQYRLVVLFLAYTGVRFGEVAALRVGRVDFLRRRALIAESMTLVRGVPTWGTPKGHERREVPIPRFLIEELAAHVAGKGRDELVFPNSLGAPMRSQVFQRAALTKAASAIGVPGLHPHELRHTAASLAIASGADVKVVQQMLGHKSATMTLDLYGHLFGDRLDEVADRLDVAATAALASARV